MHYKSEFAAYIGYRGVQLACVMILSALSIILWSGGVSYQTRWLCHMAEVMQEGSAIVFGTALIGSLLLDDILVR